MQEMSFYEGEALEACLQTALAQIGAPSNIAEKIKDRINPQQLTELNSALVDSCRRGLSRSEVEITEEQVPDGVRGSPNDMRLGPWRQADGKPRKMLFIRVRDSAPTIGLQLVGLAVAIAMLSPSAYVQALAVVKTIYDHASKLESPQDDDAMLAYQALLRHASEMAANETDPPFYVPAAKPRAADLHAFGGPSPEVTVKALKRLRELKIGDVVQWGGAGGDLDHPDNRWAHRA